MGARRGRTMKRYEESEESLSAWGRGEAGETRDEAGVSRLPRRHARRFRRHARRFRRHARRLRLGGGEPRRLNFDSVLSTESISVASLRCLGAYRSLREAFLWGGGFAVPWRLLECSPGQLLRVLAGTARPHPGSARPGSGPADRSLLRVVPTGSISVANVRHLFEFKLREAQVPTGSISVASRLIMSTVNCKTHFCSFSSSAPGPRLQSSDSVCLVGPAIRVRCVLTRDEATV